MTAIRFNAAARGSRNGYTIERFAAGDVRDDLPESLGTAFCDEQKVAVRVGAEAPADKTESGEAAPPAEAPAKPAKKK